MSYITDTLVSCPNIQERVDNIFATGGAGNGQLMEALPFLEFVASTSSMEQRMLSGGSKIRTVQVIYDQFIQESEVSENVDNPKCVATEVRGNHYQNYEIDVTDNVGSNEQITLAHFRQQCEANEDYFTRLILKHINAVDRKVATKTATQATSLTGAWNETEGANIDGATFSNNELVVSTKTSAGDPDPYTHEIINSALMVSLFDSNTFIVGGMPLYQHYRRMLAGCCSNAGIDLEEIQALYGYAVAYDKRIASAFAVDESLALRAGALQLVRFNQAEWMPQNELRQYFEAAQNYAHFVVASPQTGLPYDVSIKDDCGTIHINVVATTKLFGAPPDMFPTGSDYDGITFANKIKVTNA